LTGVSRPFNRLLAGLVDDAGLFPPEQLPMDAALARHRADEAVGHAMLSHRFLCPASRLAELRADPGLQAWTGGPPARLAERGIDRRLRLGLILDTGLDGLEAALAEVADDPRVTLDLAEVPAPSAEAVTAALDAVAGINTPVYIEGPREPAWIKEVAVGRGPGRPAGDDGRREVAEAGQSGGLRGAKVRCGGARAELFPSPEELAAFLCSCAEAAVNFKATAGLHGAVRHRDEATGFVHHGYLNLVLGTARAAARRSVEDVAEVLASTDEAALVAEFRTVSARTALLTRALFRAYGSCSTTEPREEASALGLFAEDAPPSPGPPSSGPRSGA
jgi:hypothetical protein